MASDDVLAKLDSISRRDDVGFEEYMVSLRGLQGRLTCCFGGWMLWVNKSGYNIRSLKFNLDVKE